MNPVDNFPEFYKHYLKNKHTKYTVEDIEDLLKIEENALEYGMHQKEKVVDLNFVQLPKDTTSLYRLLPRNEEIVDKATKAGVKLDMSKWDFSKLHLIPNLGEMSKVINNFEDTVSHWDLKNVESMSEVFKDAEINKPLNLNLPKATDLSKMFENAVIKAPVTVKAPNATTFENLLDEAKAYAPVDVEDSWKVFEFDGMYDTTNTYMFDMSPLDKVFKNPKRLELLSDIPEKFKLMNSAVEKVKKAYNYGIDKNTEVDDSLVFYTPDSDYTGGPSGIRDDIGESDDPQREVDYEEAVKEIFHPVDFEDVFEHPEKYKEANLTKEECKAALDLLKIHNLSSDSLLEVSDDELSLQTESEDPKKLSLELSLGVINSNLGISTVYWPNYVNTMAALKGESKKPYPDEPLLPAKHLHQKSEWPSAIAHILQQGATPNQEFMKQYLGCE